MKLALMNFPLGDACRYPDGTVSLQDKQTQAERSFFYQLYSHAETQKSTRCAYSRILLALGPFNLDNGLENALSIIQKLLPCINGGSKFVELKYVQPTKRAQNFKVSIIYGNFGLC